MKIDELKKHLKQLIREEVSAEVSKAMAKVLVEMVKEMKKHRADIKGLVFDHDFARFLFPDDWQSHLQNMVTSPNVINYIRENVWSH